MTPNDITADIYDVVSSSVKNDQITSQEISLMSFYLPNHSKILDIGGGTGRHATILANLGYPVTVIDSSQGMLNILLKKINKSIVGKKPTLIHNDFFNTNLKAKFNLILLMWNSFNEVILTKSKMHIFFNKIKKLINNDTVIIINIDNTDNINPANFNFKFESEYKKVNYLFSWKTEKYYKKTNTSISKEEIIVKTLKSKSPISYTTYIKQRYWKLKEIKSELIKQGFKYQLKKIRGNDELYIIIKLGTI